MQFRSRYTPDARPVLAVTYRSPGGGTDAILAYSRRLTDALGASGRVGAELLEGSPAGWSAAGQERGRTLASAAKGADAMLLQYNPFSYGHRGFAPGLLRDARALRRAGLPIAVMVHEAYLRPGSLRQQVLSAWQRVQLSGLLRNVDLAFASTEAVAEQVQGCRHDLDVHHLPVGSNLPDRRRRREEMRRALGAGPEDVVLVAFRTGHPSQVGSALRRAVGAAAGRSSLLLNLGAGAPEVSDPPPGMRIVSPGHLSEDDLAAWLAAGDIFLAPFSDGASTRRTTLMAALQHELAVVASSGPSTGRLEHDAEGAIEFADPRAPEELEAAVTGLLVDSARRRKLALQGRELFCRAFDWPVIAARALDTLSAAWGLDALESGREQALEERHV